MREPNGKRSMLCDAGMANREDERTSWYFWTIIENHGIINNGKMGC